MSEPYLPAGAEVALGRLQEQIHGVEKDIAALDRLNETRFVTHRTMLDSQATHVALALDSADKAVMKAEAATEKRFDSVNAFRAQLSDQAKGFVSRAEFDAVRKQADIERDRLREATTEVITRQEFTARTQAVDGRLGALELARSAGEGKSAGITPIWTTALAIGGALALFLIERAIIR